jgi:hypothetical protein
MRILHTRRAAAQIAALPASTRADLLDRLRELPAIFGRPHTHGGLGLRQLKPGCFEVRAGLDVRAALLRERDDLVVVQIGNHEDIRRWLKTI